MLIDAHCHLTADVFNEDRTSVIKKAQAHGVCAFLSAATDQASWPKLIELAEANPDVSFALGIHPWFMDANDGVEHISRDSFDQDERLLALERQIARKPKGLVGLGECGVDARSESPAQWALFEAQLALAEKYRIPVVIHCVRLNDRVAKQLRQHPGIPGGLIHGFAGSLVQANRFIDQGYLVGIGGAVTFERAQKLKRVVSSLPKEGFVLESDSPDMLPAMLREKETRNTPASVALVAKHVAELRKETLEEVAHQTSRNVRNMFGL